MGVRGKVIEMIDRAWRKGRPLSVAGNLKREGRCVVTAVMGLGIDRKAATELVADLHREGIVATQRTPGEGGLRGLRVLVDLGPEPATKVKRTRRTPAKEPRSSWRYRYGPKPKAGQLTREVGERVVVRHPGEQASARQ